MKAARAAVERGLLLGLPTETVYGLAAPIDRPDLIERIFVLKERPLFDPLIVHVASVAEARDLVATWPEAAERLALRHWPGPLTLVLEKRADRVSDLITAGLPTVGLRLPAHPLARQVIEAVGAPLAAPSANKFSRTSPTTAQHVADAFSSTEVFVIDGGPSDRGIESTIVAITERAVHVLRRGVITRAALAATLGPTFAITEAGVGERPASPGAFDVHYRPRWPLVVGRQVLDATSRRRIAEVFGDAAIEALTLPDAAVLAARRLYALLHEPLHEPATVGYLAVPGAEEDELWLAIWDRLRRAASLVIT